MFLNLTCCGEHIAVNMEKVFDFHPVLGERGTLLHFDLSVPFSPGTKPPFVTHQKKHVDQSYQMICALLAEASK